jgi:hypothetical protein
MHERDRLLEQLGEIHEDWQQEMSGQVAYRPETDEPHHPEFPGLTDYQLHYTDANPTYEQEQVFQDRIKPILDRLEELRNASESEPDITDLMSKVSETEEFALAVNGDAVLMLLKTDHEEGVQYYREGGEWVKINPDDDIPALDEADLMETIGEATELWDMNEGQELSVVIFEPILLDGI